MLDFTLKIYRQLIISLLNNNYKFLPVNEYLKDLNRNTPFIIMRHDVDLLPGNALKMARIENYLGVRSTYYFRMTSGSFNQNIIKKIESLDHEIGYHYENLADTKGDYEKAINDFQYNLNKLRKVASIETICMHGSPLSKQNNLDLWNNYDYHDFNILGEPYLDINFGQVQYYTDTGRHWNNNAVSIRDKVKQLQNYNFNNTQEIILALAKNKLEHQLLFNVHPQRWTNNVLLWTIEYVAQNSKNIIKQFIARQ